MTATTGQPGTPQARPGRIVLGTGLRNPMPASVAGTSATLPSRVTGTAAQTGRKAGTA